MVVLCLVVVVLAVVVAVLSSYGYCDIGSGFGFGAASALFYLLSECVLSVCVKMSGIRRRERSLSITPPSGRESFLAAALWRLPSGRAGIESIVAQCDSGRMDDYMGAGILISLLEDLGLLYRMRIAPRLVGWHLFDESDVMEMLQDIADVGWDETANGHAICFENDPPFAVFPKLPLSSAPSPVERSILYSVTSQPASAPVRIPGSP